MPDLKISQLTTTTDPDGLFVPGARAGSNFKLDVGAIQTSIDDHIADTAGAHAGTAISNTPAGTISATTVQAAINELDTDVQAKFTLPSLTSGSILVSNGTTITQDNSNLFWDFSLRIFYVGNNTGAFTNSKAHFESSVAVALNSYSQINSTNKHAGTSASSDFVCTADNGTDSTNYVDMGINSSAYTDAAYTIGGALSAYLYSNGGTL